MAVKWYDYCLTYREGGVIQKKRANFYTIIITTPSLSGALSPNISHDVHKSYFYLRVLVRKQKIRFQNYYMNF